MSENQEFKLANMKNLHIQTLLLIVLLALAFTVEILGYLLFNRDLMGEASWGLVGAVAGYIASNLAAINSIYKSQFKVPD